MLLVVVIFYKYHKPDWQLIDAISIKCLIKEMLYVGLASEVPGEKKPSNNDFSIPN